MELRREELDSAVALELIAALNAELSATYPEEGATHFRLEQAEVSGGRGAFVVAFVDGEALGCGAVRRIDDDTAELKRMFVRPDARGRGIGRAVLAWLEDEARRLGCTRVVLETGTRQGAAVELYRRAGFCEIEPFGEYMDSPLSVCMGKPLALSGG